MSNMEEWIADTDPTDGTSYLAITNVTTTSGMVHICWQGGIESWQYVEGSSNLLGSPAHWSAIYTNPPPTQPSENILDAGPVHGLFFYRIRAERQ